MPGNTVFVSTDVLTLRTEPSHRTKLMTPVCWLPNARLHGVSPPVPPIASHRS